MISYPRVRDPQTRGLLSIPSIGIDYLVAGLKLVFVGDDISITGVTQDISVEVLTGDVGITIDGQVQEVDVELPVGSVITGPFTIAGVDLDIEIDLIAGTISDGSVSPIQPYVSCPVAASHVVAQALAASHILAEALAASHVPATPLTITPVSIQNDSIEMFQGEHKDLDFTVEDADTGGAAVDLSSVSSDDARFILQRSQCDSNDQVIKTLDDDVSFTGTELGVTGEITASLLPVDTELIDVCGLGTEESGVTSVTYWHEFFVLVGGKKHVISFGDIKIKAKTRTPATITGITMDIDIDLPVGTVA